MMAVVSALESTSTSPFGPILHPHCCSLADFIGELFVLTFISITPVCLSIIGFGTSIRGTGGGAGWIGDFFESGPNRAIHDFKTFGLGT
jgi:hypothetical protein